MDTEEAQKSANTLVAEARELLAKAAPTEDWAQDRFHFRSVKGGVYPVAGGSLHHFAAEVLYDDNDVCASVEEHLAFGIDGNAMAELFARSPSLLSALADQVEEQISLNRTQAENISACHAQMKIQSEAIEAAIPWLTMEIKDRQCTTHDQPTHCADCSLRHAAQAVKDKLTDAITPKGEQQ